jgi:hypothetical protein
MDWSNEDYVRLYSRDTTAWLMWPWQARALLPLLMRKLDRAGVLDLEGYGLRALVTHVHLPWEVIEVGIQALLDDGCVELRGERALVMPNFQDANEASKSDAQRQRECRERRRDRARAEALFSGSVTSGDEASRRATDGHETGQKRNKSQQPVTLTSADPLLTYLPASRAGHPAAPFRLEHPSGASDPSDCPSSNGHAGSASHGSDCPDTEPKPRRTRKRSSAAADSPPHPDHQRFVNLFTELFEARYRSRPTWDARRGRLVRELLADHGFDLLAERARNMFRSPPAWLAKGGTLDLLTFAQHIDKFATPADVAARPSPKRSTLVEQVREDQAAAILASQRMLDH